MIQIRIAFVLRLVDDFTGACIKRKSFRFWTDEKILHPVQKEEGLYVFLEPLEHPARITIEGTDYYPCTVEVDKHILDPEEPIADIRLYGRSGKVYSGGREYRTGNHSDKKERLWNAIQEIMEEAEGTGSFLPWTQAVQKLKLNEQQQMLIAVLWGTETYGDRLSVEEFRRLWITRSMWSSVRCCQAGWKAPCRCFHRELSSGLRKKRNPMDWKNFLRKATGSFPWQSRQVTL